MNESKARPTPWNSRKPIRNLRDIERVRAILGDKPRDLFFFDLAVQTGVPALHLLRLRVKDLSRLKVGDELPFSKDRTSPHPVIMNEYIFRGYKEFVSKSGLAEDDYLFKSRKGSKPLTISTVSRMVNGWLRAAGLKNSGGVLTLRKTWEAHYQDNQKTEAHIETKDFGPLFNRIEVSTRQETVFGELKQAIISGRIAPGERILSREIAEQMGVSQIPVRDALARLEALGFISTQLNKGSVVNELSKEELSELVEIRLVVESMAAKRAAKKRTEEDLEELERMHNRFTRAWNDVDEWLRLNRSFHFAIYRAANMRILLHVIERLWDKYSPYLHIVYRSMSETYMRSAIGLHKGMLEGMRKGDPEEVCKWLVADLGRGEEIIYTRYELFKNTDR